MTYGELLDEARTAVGGPNNPNVEYDASVLAADEIFAATVHAIKEMVPRPSLKAGKVRLIVTL